MTVIDVSEADFEAEVLDRSAVLPVVVDFWAAWCGPCRKIGPLLERAAAAREGKVVLAKVDADESPGLSELYGVQGIPAIKAFVDGEIVAEFTGALPAAQVELFFDGLVPSEASLLVAAGDEASLRRALELDPTNADAALALAQLLHAGGDKTSALALLAKLPSNNFRAAGLAARMELEDDAPAELSDAFAKLDDGDHGEGLEGLLAVLSAGEADGERVRRVIVAVLDELGVDHPLARETRRRLAAALY